MTIVLDGQGGDYPEQAVLGAIKAVNKHKDLEIIICGKAEEINKVLSDNYKGDKITVCDCREVITNNDIPTIAVRQKKDSSMVKAIRMAKEDDSIDGVVSSGNTGALLTASLFIAKRIKGISRPCLAPSLPTAVDGKCFVLVDCGANADCKPANLQHFAIMGSCYMQSLYGINNPTVAILSNGQEKGKGNELVKETYPILEATPSINFVGNVEARDILFGNYDVVVSDGFTGNAVLKTIEGTALCVMKMIKESIKNGSILQKIGGLLIKPAVKKLKSTMDVNEQAGGTVLGVDEIIVKAHGSSKEASICRCIEQTMQLANNNILARIKEDLSGLVDLEDNND